MKTITYERIRKEIQKGKRCYWILLDPDDFTLKEASKIAKEAECNGVDAILIGGSLLRSSKFNEFVFEVKKAVSIPVILFPGDSTQLSSHADALLYLSLVSGRNPSNLIGEHVKAAPVIKELNIEPISTAYMLVESGTMTSVEFMSNTRPIPRNKPAIAVAHALAAQYMGMRLIYLEAGSGALYSVPSEMISMVKENIEIPLIVGGGIRDPKTAEKKLKAGADIIVTGNMLGRSKGVSIMKEIAKIVRSF